MMIERVGGMGGRAGAVVMLLALGCAHQTLIETDPPGAEVIVDGDRVGVSPVSFPDEGSWSREYEITLRKDGFDEQRATLETSVFNPLSLALAGACGACTCGLGAL